MYKNEEWLRQKIEIEGLTLLDIANMSGVKYPSVGYFARKYGITRSKNTKKPENMERASLCKNRSWLEYQYIALDKSYDDISKEFNIGKTTISRWVKRHGLEKQGIPAHRRKNGNPQVSIACELCGTSRMQKHSKVVNGYGRFCTQSCASKSALANGLFEKLMAGSKAYFSTEEGRLQRIESGIKSTIKQNGFSSSIEKKVEAFLTSSGIEFEKQKRMYYWVVDFYIPSADLVIEVMGDYWHGNPQKFPNPSSMQIKNIRRDKGKRSYLKECGHNYMELWECDINNDFKACVDVVLAEINAMEVV